MLALLTIAFCLAAPVLGQQCPEPYGVQTYPHDTLCDKFHLVRALRISKLCNSYETEQAMITLQEMSVLIAYMVHKWPS